MTLGQVGRERASFAGGGWVGVIAVTGGALAVVLSLVVFVMDRFV